MNVFYQKGRKQNLFSNETGESITFCLKMDTAFSDLHVSFKRALAPSRENRGTRQNIKFIKINKKLQR